MAEKIKLPEDGNMGSVKNSSSTDQPLPKMKKPQAIDPRAPVSHHFRGAFHRIDGVVMYLSVIIYFFTAIFFSLRNLLSDTHPPNEWNIVTAAVCMMPFMVVIYFNFDIMSADNTKYSRTKNALIFLGMTVYFFYVFLQR